MQQRAGVDEPAPGQSPQTGAGAAPREAEPTAGAARGPAPAGADGHAEPKADEGGTRRRGRGTRRKGGRRDHRHAPGKGRPAGAGAARATRSAKRGGRKGAAAPGRRGRAADPGAIQIPRRYRSRVGRDAARASDRSQSGGPARSAGGPPEQHRTGRSNRPETSLQESRGRSPLLVLGIVLILIRLNVGSQTSKIRQKSHRNKMGKRG